LPPADYGAVRNLQTTLHQRQYSTNRQRRP